MQRVRRLLYPQRPSGAWAPLAAGAILMAACAAMTLGAWQAQPGDGGRKQGGSVETPYEKWLGEDVAYIIEDAERAAYEKLATDGERQHFIGQFWARRDPTSGTAANEFKEEHYRRIAYANDRFRTASGRAGWRTDRGHMYIVYGPPDEKESHPSGAPGVYPWEIWLYRRVEGIGERLTVTFVDRGGTGDFRITPGKSR